MPERKSVLDLDVVDLLHLDGSLLTAIREELGIPTLEMAEKLQCHTSTLNRYENGKMTIPVSAILQVKKLLDEEREKREIHLSPDTKGTDQKRPPRPASVWPIALARGPLPPGAKLIEMIAIEMQSSVTRMFAAVVKPEEPSPDHEVKQGLVVDASNASPGDAQSRPATISSTLVRRAVARVRSTATHLDWAMAVSLAVLIFPAGCFQSWHARAPLRGGRDGSVSTQEASSCQVAQSHAQLSPWQAPSIWQGLASDPQAPAGEKPLEPFEWQKRAPCAPSKGEVEVDGGCWWQLESTLPCPPVAMRRNGKCLVPVPKGPRTADRQ